MINDYQKQQRVTLWKVLLNQLNVLNHCDVITSDESWFYFSYSGDGMWVKDRSELEIVENQTNYSKKVMICIFWNFYDLFMIDCVPEEETYNTDFVIFTLFPKIHEVACSHRAVGELKSYALHWDNAPSHKSRDTNAAVAELFKCSLIHPPYSPDLAPSDFFLFGYLKRGLVGKKIENVQQLKNEITNVFKTITREMKMNVFNEWKRRLEEVVENDGKYA